MFFDNWSWAGCAVKTVEGVRFEIAPHSKGLLSGFNFDLTGDS